MILRRVIEHGKNQHCPGVKRGLAQWGYVDETELIELRKWATCLIHLIEAARTFDALCKRSNYVLAP